MNMTGARYIVKFLENQGVRIVTGIPGGSILPLYDAIVEQDAVRHVLARNEQGAAFMAQGMSRLTGRPGVCLATSGPGATNLVTAIADAQRDGVPLVCLTGQVPLSCLGTEAFQEVDIVAITRPVTKSSRMVRSATELPRALTEAFELAVSGRPGPVLVDIPKDVQLEVMADIPTFGSASGSPQDAACPGSAVQDGGSTSLRVRSRNTSESRAGQAGDREPAGAAGSGNQGVRFPPAVLAGPGDQASPPAWDVSRAAAMINSAERPVLLLGGGAARPEAAGWAVKLAERAGLPVTMTLMGLGAVPASHPLSLGMHGMHGHAWANHALEKCDLLLAVGNRFDDRATGDPATFCPGARIVHVNLDPTELNRIKRVDLGIADDSARFLSALMPLVERRTRARWQARIARFKAEAPARRVCGEPGCARSLIGAVAERLSQDAVIVTDVGQHQMFVAQDFPFCAPGRFLTSGGLGVMGFGLPAAIGAALVDPKAQVVCFSGDGSLKMNVQELATLAETGANVKIVVLDNRSLGLVVQQQKLFFGGRTSASRFGTGTDFAALAEAFGVPGVSLDSHPNPEAALDEALNAQGPVLIHANVDREAMVFPMVPPGAANSRMLHSQAQTPEARLPKAVNMG